MIISLINQKGGVGKTTLSINIADCLSRMGHRVLVVDADRQGSANTWSSLRSDTPFQVIALPRPNLSKDVKKMAENYDFVIIDSPPHATEIARSCIAAADLILMPIEPSGLSTWSSDLTVRQVREASEFKELSATFLVSRKISGTIISREIRKQAEEYEMPIFDAEVTSRVAFAESMTLGRTIFEYAPYSEAAREIEAVTNEIIDDHRRKKDV